MNDLDLLRTLGSELDPTDGVPPARLRHRVISEMTDSSNRRPGGLYSITGRVPSRIQGGRNWTAWGLTAAASVAAVALVATNVPHGANGTESVASANLNGSQVLLLAAEHAGKASTATGKYWLSASEYHDLELASPKSDPYKVDSGVLRESWMAGSDSAPSRFLVKYLAMKPADSTDQAAWKRAGSPATVDVQYLDQSLKVGVKKGVPVGVSTTEVSERPARDSVKGEGAAKAGVNFTISQTQLTLRQVRDLPTDQAALRKIMLGGYDTNADAWTQDRWLFSGAIDVLTLPVTPQVRASVYRILAGLPSVRNLGQASDIKGRSGNAVAINWNSSEGQQEDRLIIDGKTGNLLAEESRLLKPIAKITWLKPTDVASTTVFTRTGWTDDTPPAKTSMK